MSDIGGRPPGPQSWAAPPTARVTLPPGGWYPDGSGHLRWWDGTAWTGHVSPRPMPATRAPGPSRGTSRRLVTGVVLLAFAGLAMVAGGLAVMGDPYPISRVGVAVDGDRVVVVDAVCPGERLQRVTLVRDVDAGPSEELWRASGDAPLPDRFPLGSAPSGLRTDRALARLPASTDQLSLRVETSELGTPYSMRFTTADVPATGVLSFGTVYPTVDAFRRASIADTPCDDPYTRRGPERFLRVMVALAGVSGLLGLGLLASSAMRPRRSG